MTNNQNLKKEEIKTSEATQVNDFKKFKIIRHIQKNVGALTFLTTSTAVVGSIIIRCIMYLYEYGKVKYYNVSPSLIDVSNENILYEFLVIGSFALLFLMLNFLPYRLWKGNKKTLGKIALSLLIILSPEVIMLTAFIIDCLKGIKSSLLNYFLLGLLLGIAIFSFGLCNGIGEYITKHKQNKKNTDQQNITLSDSTESGLEKAAKIKIPKMIAMIVVLFSILSALFILAGALSKLTQTQFKVIDNGNDKYYAVIYENQDKYVITPCKIENGFVDFEDDDTKQEIDRLGITYKWMQKKA